MNAHATPPRSPKAGYAGKVIIRHLVEAAKAAGLDPAGIKAFPDGTVEVLDARAVPKSGNLFDEFERKGEL